MQTFKQFWSKKQKREPQNLSEDKDNVPANPINNKN